MCRTIFKFIVLSTYTKRFQQWRHIELKMLVHTHSGPRNPNPVAGFQVV